MGWGGARSVQCGCMACKPQLAGFLTSACIWFVLAGAAQACAASAEVGALRFSEHAVRALWAAQPAPQLDVSPI